MTALWIILGILAFLFLLLNLPVHFLISGDYDGAEEEEEKRASAGVVMRILFLSFPLFPKKEKDKDRIKKKKKRKKHKKKVKKPEKNESDAPKKKKKGSLTDLLDLIFTLVKKLVDLSARFACLTVKRFYVCVGSDDAAKTALLYGAVSQAVSYLFAFLDEQISFRIAGKESVHVGVDFLAPACKADIKLDFRLRVWQIPYIVLGVALAMTRRKAQKAAEAQKARMQRVGTRQAVAQNHTFSGNATRNAGTYKNEKNKESYRQ